MTLILAPPTFLFIVQQRQFLLVSPFPQQTSTLPPHYSWGCALPSRSTISRGIRACNGKGEAVKLPSSSLTPVVLFKIEALVSKGIISPQIKWISGSGNIYSCLQYTSWLPCLSHLLLFGLTCSLDNADCGLGYELV